MVKLVTDYRSLKAITFRDEYPIPRIYDLINGLGQAAWFFVLDVQTGYRQVAVAVEDQRKAAFGTGHGTGQFTVMPFGLSGAPSASQRPTQDILLKRAG